MAAAAWSGPPWVARFEGGSGVRPNLSILFHAPGLAERVPFENASHHWVLAPGAGGIVGRLDLKDTWWAIVQGVDVDHRRRGPRRNGAHPDRRRHAGRDHRHRQMELPDAAGRPVPVRRTSEPADRRGCRAPESAVGRARLQHLRRRRGERRLETRRCGEWVGQGRTFCPATNRSVGRWRPAPSRTPAPTTRRWRTTSPAICSARTGRRPTRRGPPSPLTCRSRRANSIRWAWFSATTTPTRRWSPMTAPRCRPRTRSTTPPALTRDCLLPHAWMSDGSSVYDHSDKGFTLITLPGVDARYRARRRQSPPTTASPSRCSRSPTGTSKAIPDICGNAGRADLLLVRPDQHVAWRGDRRQRRSSSADPGGRLVTRESARCTCTYRPHEILQLWIHTVLIQKQQLSFDGTGGWSGR